jgi:hypothetical protein
MTSPSAVRGLRREACERHLRTTGTAEGRSGSGIHPKTDKG